LARNPLADESTTAATVYVKLFPAGRFTVSLMLPLPVAVHVAPADGAQLQAALAIDAGNTSLTFAPVTAPGPKLLTTIV
jgi:hypothetical protein